MTSTVESTECRRCGRRLRSQKAMELGIGPVCIRKEAIEKKKEAEKQEQQQLEFSAP